MIQLEIDQGWMKEIFMKKVKESIASFEREVFFMNSAQLSTYLNMSWNSIATHLLYDEEFPALRNGSKWLFNRQEVDLYMKKYYLDVRAQGGNIANYKRRK